MDTTMLTHLLHRPADANKYDFGHVLILGGSPDMVGALLISGEATLRVGAGLVTVTSDAETISRVAGKKEELITLSLSPIYSQEDENKLLDYIRERHVTTLAVGPGITEKAFALIRSIVPKLDVPIVLDAGGFTAFKDDLALLRNLAERHTVVITPHQGEFSELTGEEYDSHADAGAAAKEFAAHYGLTVVLKGNRTLVAKPDGKAFINLTGNPGMATAGTGDVLTGMIAGLVGQKIPITDAAEIAVYVHGLAGDIAAEEETEPGMIASDIIRNIPTALQKIAFAED